MSKTQLCILFLLATQYLVSSLTYSNPLVVSPMNSPDPGALYYNGNYYVAATTDHNEDPNKFPIHSSSDLVNWSSLGWVFPQGRYPSWAVEDFWAPEIHQLGPHYFVTYFAVRDDTGVLCVGAASANNVTGPFTDIGYPLVRNSSVGNIDPTYYFDQDTQTKYLIWKEDGNGRVPPETYTPIWAQQLSRDGLSLTGDKVEILKNDPSSWEGVLVEAPWVIKTNGMYYLFYSANGYLSTRYAIGVARSKSLLGPYEKCPNNPIVHSNAQWSGPGHCSVLSVQNAQEDYFFVYHSWAANQIGGNYPRELLMDNIKWSSNGWPYINNSSPSFQPQPVPGQQ